MAAAEGRQRFELARLDDLLGGADENPRQQRGPAWRLLMIVLRAVGIAAVVAGALFGLGILLFEVAVPYALLFAVVFALVIARDIVVGLQPPPPSAAPIRESIDAQAFAFPDRPFVAVRRWENRLEWTGHHRRVTTADQHRFVTIVIPAVAEIVDERLRLGYSVSREHHPERAEEILGPRVWQLLSITHPDQAPSPREFAAMVKELEEL